MVTFSHAGYVKAQPLADYRAQRRGGRGKTATTMKEDDFIERLFVAHSHDYLLCFSNRGRCYWLKVHEIEQAGRMARGRPLVNHLEGLNRDERVQAVVPVKEFDEQHFLVCATRKGLIKKTVLSAYGNVRKAGINAVLLEEGDALFEALERFEPSSMQGQPPALIDRAEGWYVSDRWGNRWDLIQPSAS